MGDLKHQATMYWLGIHNTLGFVTKHMNPEGRNMKEQRVPMPSLKPHTQDMLGPGSAQSSGDAKHSPRLFPGRGTPQLHQRGLSELDGKWGGRHCRSNYTVLQVPATARCAQRPSSERSPAKQQFPCSYQAQKCWQGEHLTTLIHQQPHHMPCAHTARAPLQFFILEDSRSYSVSSAHT